MKNIFTRYSYTSLSVLNITGIMLCAAAAFSFIAMPEGTDHEVYFKNTEYELNIYRITGEKPGPTVLVIGGIHNEPGGYLTADFYVDIALKRGNLIVVPRANFQTIIDDKRGILGDMNRLFNLKEARFENDHAMKIVAILKELIAESDMMLNLHDGSGFYRSEYVDEMHNSLRLGQSIIADTDIFIVPGTDKRIPLQEIGENICAAVNMEIENEDHFFQFNNHNTYSDKTPHIEQRGSATFYALSNHHIPAFGIETSKNIADIELLVRYQTIIVNAFLKEFGVIPDMIRKPIVEPRLKFIALSINDDQPRLVFNNETLQLHHGDTIEIEHIEANYERGVFADVSRHGTTNDLGKAIAIFSNAEVLVKKDNKVFGKITIALSENGTKGTDWLSTSNGHSTMPSVDQFIIEVNGFIQNIPASGVLSIVRGDAIKIIDTSPSVDVFQGSQLNLFGFWSKKQRNNSGNDRNIVINSATDLDSRYSVREKGTEYEIRLENDAQLISSMRLKLIEPALKNLVLKFDNGNMGLLKNGEFYSVTNEQTVEIVAVNTTIPNNTNVQINVKGFVGSNTGSDMFIPIDMAMELIPEYSVDNYGRTFTIEVTYRSKVIGEAFLRVNTENYDNNR